MKRRPPAGRSRAASGFSSEIARALAATAPGEVLTYGELARLAGRPGAARAVGLALRRSEGLPWWRVVTASGRLVPGLEERQRRALEEEGAAFPIAGAARQARPGQEER